MPRQADPKLLIALGGRIRALRDRADLSQQALAERMGVEVASVSRMEAGRVNVTVGTLHLLARALGVPLGDIVDQARDIGAGEAPATGELLAVWDMLDEHGRDLGLRLLREVARGEPRQPR